MIRVILSILLAGLLSSALGACGKKGDPEVPTGQVDTLTKYRYPPPDEDDKPPPPAEK